MGLEQTHRLFEAFLGGCNGLFSAETAAFETLNVFRLGFRGEPSLLKLDQRFLLGSMGFFQGGFLAFQPFFGGLALFLKGCDPFLEQLRSPSRP